MVADVTGSRGPRPGRTGPKDGETRVDGDGTLLIAPYPCSSSLSSSYIPCSCAVTSSTGVYWSFDLYERRSIPSQLAVQVESRWWSKKNKGSLRDVSD